MKTSNPVLSRLADRSERHATFRPAPASGGMGGMGGVYADSTYAPAATDRMTLDDVVIRSIGMLAVVAITGALSWTLLPDTKLMPFALWGALGVGFILGLVISFARITNPLVILTYAAVEGVFVGLISRFFEQAYGGIVVQAVTGTLGLFIGMALLYKFRIIRATPTFVKWVLGALIGVTVLMVVNFLAAAFGANGGAGLGLRDGGTLAIVFSLVCIGVASLTFILDFAAIEAGVQFGAERRYAWYAAFGIVVGLIWLYLEILRLIGYLRR